MAKAIYPLDYILKLLLDGKVQEGTQALSDYVQDMKEKRGRAGRAGDKGKKKAAARKRWAARSAVPVDLYADNPPEGYWEARHGRGSGIVIDEFCGAPPGSFAKHIQEQQSEGVRYTKPALKELQEGAIMGGLKRSPVLPPGVMKGSDLEGRG